MSNICINSITFTSTNLTLLQDLHKHILDIASDKSKNSIDNLLKAYNFSLAEIIIMSDKRDYISDIKGIEQREGIYLFSTETCTAWDEHMLPFFVLLKERYNNQITLYFQSEEEGEGIYIYHDPTGLFYKDRFKSDYCYKGEYSTEYFHAYQDMISHLSKQFPKANLNIFMSIAEAENAIRDNYEDDSDDDFFVTLNAFVPFNTNFYKHYEEVA